ncbi:MAG: DUF262 domain-containing protein, partial [Endozoicomonadaceae bacterium]|nr:DUF262 domain-containing protein [Endozoicomonadaceae bacterium]
MDSQHETILNIFTEQLFADETNVHKFKKLPKSGNEFEVPSFQRYYSWKEKQIQDLLEDIKDSIEANDENFFLGPILLRRTEDPRKFHIIDGQQRLVTLSMIISQILHYIEKDGATKSEDISRGKRCLLISENDDEVDGIDLDTLISKDYNFRLAFSLESNQSDFKLVICNKNTNNIKNEPIVKVL